MSEDWPEEETTALVVSIPLELPTEPRERVLLAEKCWPQLTSNQRRFLAAYRDAGCNARQAERDCGLSRSAHKSALHENKYYKTIVKLWQAEAGARALDRDRLLARQDAIVETLLTPKPVLFQGIPVRINGEILEEVEAGAASRANEVLLDRAMPKPRESVEVNVGVAFTPPVVEVVKSAGDTSDAIEATFVEVSPALPEDDWPDESTGEEA